VMSTGLFTESRMSRIHAEQEVGSSDPESYLCASHAV